MVRLNEVRRVDLACDVYMARVCGSRPELIVNYGYEGLWSFDVASGRALPLIPFPDGKFSIYSWAVSPRGNISILSSVESGEGLLLVDHDQGSARRIDFNGELPTMTDLAWFSPTISVLDYEGGLWTIEGPSLRKATDAEVQTCLGYFQRRVLASYGVVKTDPYERGIYVYRMNNESVTHGFMPYDANQNPLLFRAEGSGSVDVTAYDRTLFAAFEDRIVMQIEGEDPKLLVAAPDNEYFLRVNVIEHERAYLAVLSSSKDHRTPMGWVTLYEIEP